MIPINFASLYAVANTLYTYTIHGISPAVIYFTCDIMIKMAAAH